MLCVESPSKGGYNITDLKEIGILHFDIEPNVANKMNKKELCNIIIPQIIKNNEHIATVKTEIYPNTKNIEQCTLPERKGELIKSN